MLQQTHVLGNFYFLAFCPVFQIEEKAMVPAKEAKEILYNMFAQNFVTITVSSAVSVLLYSTCIRDPKYLETCLKTVGEFARCADTDETAHL